MHLRKVLQQMIGMMLALLLTGCGASTSAPVSQAPTAQSSAISPTSASISAPPTSAPPSGPPTSVPTSIPPTPAPQSGPKGGHWEGTQPTVSFDVTNDGKIHNFNMDFPLSSGQGTCTIKGAEFAINADSTFNFTESIEVSKIDKNVLEVAQKLGVAPEVTKTSSGDMIEAQHISGKFDSDTSLTGTFKFLVCGSAVDFSSSPGTWKAKWEKP